ncbi:MAG: DUF3108 domain-containing protein [Candidatus Thiodiazotropha lotti]|uniref:DUF3108 domain-containing protein n=1 Tax=Candidatus Thiodiazotropha endoloripes TaxID=1818881 RepID=A0A1E2ULB9_9GAMM|nr:DUF3108 domain-containing protein [Candidatus Thiodiazotropha endoloripes]MCG7898864.1 DUF3108 domain-containing protein [Candidatus Thiodiazotropha weberae]MCG7992233.1 DUF3108 domain-containing protein [Candidatus Thiodiazotropha lotti]MCG7904209.1 DUF3108 domain-containing protein [Candidatus Thiodiazotropha weberae]MCG7915653.1 DUF3108 domain-containing protein [Candidatus Thiodiazotropha weberae]MCG8001512.1 DUF3108 domain-containing protein [Candidatus Thiodiazotropha lotti]
MARHAAFQIRLLGVFLSCFISLNAAAEDLLKPFSAEFTVHRNILPLGRLTLSLELKPDGSYIYTAHSQPSLLANLFSRNEVIEESRGRYLEGRVVPHRYTYQDKDQQSENNEVSFDWQSAHAATTSQGVTWSQPIGDATQDKLSQQLQVRLHLAQGNQQVSYQVADGGKVKTYHFQVVGEETVASSNHSYHCLRVERSKGDGASDYTIWFARELDYLPIKIERSQSGKLYRMMLDELHSPEGAVAVETSS